jgi:hypothetical protein
MKRLFTTLATLTIALTLTAESHAYLGGFEQADGYLFDIANNPPLHNWIDVSYYNAGQSGANAGGGAVTPIVPNSGLWKITGNGPGGFYKDLADRTTYLLSTSPPPYPNPSSSAAPPGGFTAAYTVGDHTGGRLGTRALAMRNFNSPGIGPINMDYTIDTFDFGGITPSSVTTGPVGVKFYFWSNDPEANGKNIDKFVMSFKDSGGTTGFQWGYARDNELQWRAGSTGAWNYTGVYSDNLNYDGMDVKIDLTADTFSMDFYDFTTNTWSNLVPLTAMGGSNAMTDLTHLGWALSDNVNNGVWAGKNFFDDFQMGPPVPEPSALALIGLGAAGLLRRRSGGRAEA